MYMYVFMCTYLYVYIGIDRRVCVYIFLCIFLCKCCGKSRDQGKDDLTSRSL